MCAVGNRSGWYERVDKFQASMSPIDLTIVATVAVAIVAGLLVRALAPTRSVLAPVATVVATFLLALSVAHVAGRISDPANTGGSSVLGTIDQYLPGAQQPLVTTPPVTSTQPNSYDGSSTAALTADEASTVKVVSSACDMTMRGSGFSIAPGLVLTNAHVVAGDPRPFIENGPSRYPATTVAFDPGLDIAILRVPTLTTAPLQLVAGTVQPRTPATVLGYPYGGTLTSSPATILSRRDASGVDIYGKSPSTRDVYELRGAVRPGNSGGPLVAENGDVLGVVFAYSLDDPNLGFALTSKGVHSMVQLGQAAIHPVSASLCAAEGPGVIEVSGA